MARESSKLNVLLASHIEHFGATCRGCDARIFGVRHKCIDCLDFDLCQACISVPSIRVQHQTTHTFFPVEYPWDHSPLLQVSNVAYELFRSGFCGGCMQRPLVGTAYLCLTCDGYSFCTTCFYTIEHQQANNVSHVLFPVRTPEDYDGYWAARASLQHNSAFSELNSTVPDVDVRGHIRHENCDALRLGPCDVCNNPAEHVCVECCEYRLCTACIVQSEIRMAHHPAHSYTPLRPPNANLDGADPVEGVDAETETRCCGCQGRISRIQHHCLECPTFILCDQCHSSVRERVAHNARHRFFPTEYPWNTAALENARAVSDKAKCCGCGIGTSAVQLRCLVCSDFFLCTRCAADPNQRVRHDLSHPFFPWSSDPGEADYNLRREQLMAYRASGRTTEEDYRCARVILNAGLRKRLVHPRIFIRLSGTSVCVSTENTPWTRPTSIVTVPAFIEERVDRSLPADLTYGFDLTYAENNRMISWGLIHLAASGIVPVQNLFRKRASGAGEVYTLVPSTRSALPAQCIHVGQGAIPSTLADTPCDLVRAVDLLDELNTVMGTSHTLDTPGLRECLDYALATALDFGTVYGTLRSWWRGTGGFVSAFAQMHECRDKDQRRRENAIRRSCIEDSRLPPRRVWDLYSNRVLPFHVVNWPPLANPHEIPSNLWTVSHSWVAEHNRGAALTPINGHQWPVPIPRGTSLEHVRIELLNSGAEYVWLDVLCLRQEGSAEDDVRLKEWKLDVPTIGYVYRAQPFNRPCVTYFNGLGLPLDASPAVVASERHWFNRVWTVQEISLMWLPGGFTATLIPCEASALTVRMQYLVMCMFHMDRERYLYKELMIRHCTNELDRVCASNYNVTDQTLPLYDASISVEAAWTQLIKHFSPVARMLLYLLYGPKQPTGLWPSWREFLQAEHIFEVQWTYAFECASDATNLELVDPLQRYTDEPAIYTHTAHTLGPCHVANSDGPTGYYQFHFYHEGQDAIVITVSPKSTVGRVVPEVEYHLLGFGKTWKFAWAVVEIVGTQLVRGEEALEALKWGVIQMEQEESEKLAAADLKGREKRVVYPLSTEALSKSKHADKYAQSRVA